MGGAEVHHTHHHHQYLVFSISISCIISIISSIGILVFSIIISCSNSECFHLFSLLLLPPPPLSTLPAARSRPSGKASPQRSECCYVLCYRAVLTTWAGVG